MLNLALLLACPKPTSPDTTPVGTPVQLALDPTMPSLCISQVPEAGRLKGNAAAWSDATAHLTAGNLPQATAALTAASDHPGIDSARVALAVLEGRPEDARALARDLVNAWPTDPCLNQTAALIYLYAREPTLARTHATDAWRLAPEDPDVLYLYGLTQLSAGDSDKATTAMRGVIANRPGHPGASYLLGSEYLSRGHSDLALPLLEDALAGGINVTGPLAEAYYRDGRTSDYIRIASLVGWPIGDGGSIAEAADPLAAWKSHLGIGEGDQLIATFVTSMGEIDCMLYWESAPLTVSSFVGLATGRIEWRDPVTDQLRQDPLYSNTIFHRVIPEFMIQAGDPAGNGTGGPGYRFHDEIDPKRHFDKPGVLAMANSGPSTNGSQFFITEVPVPHLDGMHTIFGQCDGEQLGTIKAIARVEQGADNVPVEPVRLEEIRVVGR
ncbi:MAG: peptidyl-prolyl cis-trans isomerase A (cyclophilin A) [Myxococcota bacterium]|jgi:peptidyl-prolyl cis-trans isomerase A (cyclophilin A)